MVLSWSNVVFREAAAKTVNVPESADPDVAADDGAVADVAAAELAEVAGVGVLPPPELLEHPATTRARAPATAIARRADRRITSPSGLRR
jgi:hypothetical protein